MLGLSGVVGNIMGGDDGVFGVAGGGVWWWWLMCC